MGNKALLRKTVDTVVKRAFSGEGLVTTIHKKFPSGMELALAVKIPSVNRKADLKPCMEELSLCGFKQQAISLFTETSQSYVSKLLGIKTVNMK